MEDNNAERDMSTDRHGSGTYQMLWDCKFCDTQKLLGVTHRHCPNCGAPQDPEYRYFPAEEDMIALEDHRYVGADKVCPACQEPNSAAATYCVSCGADLATGQVAETQGVRDLGTGRAASDTRQDVVKEKFEAEQARIRADEVARRTFLGLRKRQWVIVGLVALVAVCVIGAALLIFYRQEASGTVTGLTWERIIQIEDFQPRVGAGWDETVPGDAYGRSCEERQRGTRKVEVGSHEECRDVDQGDGSFRRECRTVKDYADEPVYDSWCIYTVDRWDYAREVTASGERDNPAPHWPQYTLASGTRRYGQERVGKKIERYDIVIREDDGDEHTCTVDDIATWNQYRVGMSVALQVTLLGAVDCDSLTIAD